MMGALLDAFLTHRDTIHHGWTRAGIAFGITTVAGQHWCIPGSPGAEALACVGLHRGDTQKSIDLKAPVGLALGKASSVKNLTFRGHAAGTWYVYQAIGYNGAGVPGPGDPRPARVRTDGSGAIIDPLVPNPPSFINARALAGGKVLVVVGYAAQGQGVKPMDLRVYGKSVDPINPVTSDIFDAGNRQTDEPSGVTEIPYGVGKQRYEFKVGAKPDAEWWIFAAAFRNAGGVEAQSSKVSNVIQIDATGAAQLGIVGLA